MSKDKFANKLQTKFAGISFYIFIKKKKKTPASYALFRSRARK